MTLYEIIKALQNASGNLEKSAILLTHKDNALFKAFMKATYDVSLSYYITNKAIPDAPGAGLATMDEDLIKWMVSEMAGVKPITGKRLSGNFAKQCMGQTLAALDAEGQELLRLLVDRSIGASVGDTMVLDTWPGLYFIPPYMRCASMSEKAREAFAEEDYFYVQTKRDGSFAYINPGRICTRQGSCYPDWFVGLMTGGLGNNEVLVGEMEVYLSGTLLSRKEGNGVLNSVLQGADESEFAGYEFKYVAWDRLSLGEFEMGRSDRPYVDRWRYLEALVKDGVYNANIELVACWEVRSVAEAKAIHTNLTARGLEGSVWKRKQGIWKDTSSGTIDAVKVKVVAEAEFVVTDFYEGKGKAKGMLGGLTIMTRCGKMKCNMGSGFSDKQRKEIWADILKGEQPIGWIITAEFNDITTARGKDTVSLSLPIFIERRFDRTEADTLERVYEQFEAAKLGK